MEFIIVAPLYFILLGGLFILGDLAVNRIRVHIGDHFVTWVGGSRFCPVDGNGNKDKNKVQAILKPLYDLSIGGAVNGVGFKVDSSDDRASAGNHANLNSFMKFHMGKVKRLPLKMPGWARGMFTMNDAMEGKDGSGEYEDMVFNRDRGFSSYVFHRCALSGIDKYAPSAEKDGYSRSRGISADRLVHGDYVSSVVGDFWISDPGYGDGGGVGNSQSGSAQSMGEVPRYLGYFGE